MSPEPWHKDTGPGPLHLHEEISGLLRYDAVNNRFDTLGCQQMTGLVSFFVRGKAFYWNKKGALRHLVYLNEPNNHQS